MDRAAAAGYIAHERTGERGQEADTLAQPGRVLGRRGALFFTPDGPGFARVTVIDAAGASDSVMVHLEDANAQGTLVRITP